MVINIRDWMLPQVSLEVPKMWCSNSDIWGTETVPFGEYAALINTDNNGLYTERARVILQFPMQVSETKSKKGLGNIFWGKTSIFRSTFLRKVK